MKFPRMTSHQPVRESKETMTFMTQPKLQHPLYTFQVIYMSTFTFKINLIKMMHLAKLQLHVSTSQTHARTFVNTS